MKDHESTPKPWAPPWALKIPEWEEVWFAVEKSGSGNFYNSEPFLGDELHEWISMGGTRLAECGLFEIPPGADWRTMKARVR